MKNLFLLTINQKFRPLYFFCLTMAFFGLFNACTEANLTLIEKTSSDYQIIIPNAETPFQEAALELQSYLQQIGSVQLPIVEEKERDEGKPVIWLREHETAIGSKDGIAIKNLGKDIFIESGSKEILQYAVYEFLEVFLDCKWYAPAAEIIPEQEVVLLPKMIDYSYIPEITTRTVHSRLFYDNEAFAAKHKVTTESFPYYVPRARVHTFHRFLPEEKFYQNHPEYYALRGEQRLPTQLCLTNEAVLDIVIDSVRALFNRYPGAQVISVSQDDNQQHCQCDACSKIDEAEGSPSGTMIQFVNKVAEQFPEKTISTLAYQYTRKPCKTKPADNVLITLCSIECDRSAPIAEKCSDFAEDLIGWGKLTDNIRIWDYTTQFTNFLAPFPNLQTLQANIQLFRDNNAKWVFEQHSSNPSELFELRSYLLAKLLWKPEANVDSLIVDFTNGYYEEAGSFVKKYIDRIHAELNNDPEFFLFLYGDPSQAFDSYLKPDLLAMYSQWFDAAEEAVADKPEILNRVKKARLGVDYAVLEACRKNIAAQFQLVEMDEQGQKSVNPLVEERLGNFYQVCQKNEINLMNEMRFTVEEYYQNYQAALKVALKPNKALGKKVVSITKPKKYANEDPMVLTDGALGGSSFYANWLGYEGNDMEVVIDFGEPLEISKISMAFLQVTNHVVFFPKEVAYLASLDGATYFELGTVQNQHPLTKSSKVNDIQYFDLNFDARQLRYIKVKANNTPTPYWHHAAGLPSWVFADEIIVE